MSDEVRPWIQTMTCNKFDLLDPHWKSIDVLDIAHALGNLCRWTGHTYKFYSVAEHCCHCHDLIDEEIRLQGRLGPASHHVRAWALMHDAEEAYYGDVSSPLKRIVGFHLGLCTEKFGKAMLKRWPRLVTAFKPPEVTSVDLRMLSTECRDLFPVGHPTWEWTPPPPFEESPIRCWDPKTAKEEFLKRFKALDIERPV